MGAGTREGWVGVGRGGGPRRVPLGAWLEPDPSGLSQSAERRLKPPQLRCEPLDHLQAAGSLSMHRELSALSRSQPLTAPLVAQLRARRPLACQAHRRARPVAVAESERQAGQWPGAPSGLHLRSPDSAAALPTRLQFCPEPSTFLQPPDLAHKPLSTPKIEIFHSWNRTAPFVSSDTTRRADHYGVLRYGRLQRVVSRLQVKVWSAVAARYGVGAESA